MAKFILDPTLDDTLGKIELTPRVEKLKEAYFKAMPEVCVERPLKITEYSRKERLFDKERITVLDKARLYRKVLEEKEPIITQKTAYEKGAICGKNRRKPRKFNITAQSLFAGATTTKFKGVPLFPEFSSSLMLWPELWSISTRISNPLRLDEDDAKELNSKVFPFWIDKTILEIAREQSYEEEYEKQAKNKVKKEDMKKEAPEIALMQLMAFFVDTKANCISHTIPDLKSPIDKGLKAIIEEAREKRKAGGDPDFYQALEEVLEGIIQYSKNLAVEADKLAKVEKNGARKEELEELVRIHEKVPEKKADTFREGLTTIWVCWMALHLENPNLALSLGRMDQYLHDLYRTDIDNGTITVEDAVELLCCLWLKIGDHVPTMPEAGEKLYGGSGSNQAITIGGVDKKNGEDAVNDLTYVILRAIELMKLRDPNLNARYHPDKNDDRYLSRLTDVNFTTGATPAIHNDRAIIKALTRRGDTPEQARDYGVIGCVEPVSAGRTYGHTGAIMLNITSALELTLFKGQHRHTDYDREFNELTGDPIDFATFDDFKAAFEKQFIWLAGNALNLNRILGQVHQRQYPTPIMSALFEGPMENGKDVIEGGATLNSSGVAIVGFADVADSLSAIEYHVYKKKNYTMAEMIKAIDKDFEGFEAMQEVLFNPAKTPKYGNTVQQNLGADVKIGNANAAYLVKFMETYFMEKENYRGGNYRVGYWTMTNHAGFGRMMGASPSGRKKRYNFTSGSTPVSGVTPCLLETLHSVAELPVEYVTSGMAFNIKYTPPMGGKSEAVKDAMKDRFTEYMRVYFGGKQDPAVKDQHPGGMEIQFNVTDHATFLRAADDPEHPDFDELLVRVSGYTAYFKDLNPQMRMEIINRTEYNLHNGSEVKFERYKLKESQTC